MTNRIVRWASLLAVMLAGLVIAIVGVLSTVNSVRCEHWPTTPGVILSAKKFYDTPNRDRSGTSHWGVDISYGYKVGADYYVGTKVSFASGMEGSEGFANELLRRYAVGKQIPVYYFPKEPQQAVLEPGIQRQTWGCLGLGLFIVALAGFLIKSMKQTIPEVDESVWNSPRG